MTVHGDEESVGCNMGILVCRCRQIARNFGDDAGKWGNIMENDYSRQRNGLFFGDDHGDDHGDGAWRRCMMTMLEDIATMADNPYYNRFYAYDLNQA